MRVTLPYGTRAYTVVVPPERVAETRVLAPAPLPPPPPLRALLDAAVDRPHAGSPPLADRARDASRVTIIVSDATRAEPRAAFIEVVRARLPVGARITLAIATGTHGPADLAALELPPALLRDVAIVNHDGHRPDELVEVGSTTRGTPVRVHRCVVDTDLVIATGCIRPHYFAGFGAGAKAVFPGMGEATAIRINHLLKLERDARAGVVVGNPCRDDLEEAARMIPARAFLVNGVCDLEDQIHAVVAGDLVDAFRAGCEIARPWYRVHATPAPLVIASDGLPVTASLYQAAKIAAAAAPLVAPGGTLAIVAECPEGIGPLDTVNEAIFRIGIVPRLPPAVRLVLVSGIGKSETCRTLLAYGSSVEELIADSRGPILMLPHASKLLAHGENQ